MARTCAERIAALKETRDEWEDAEASLIVGTIQSYTIDTGQSRQTVTKVNITEFRKAIDSLSNRIATLEARCYGNGVTRVVPGW